MKAVNFAKPKPQFFSNDITEDPNFILELLKCRFTAQQDLCSDFAKGCAVWILAVGFLMNSAFIVQTITPRQLKILCIGGILFTCIGLALNFFTNRVRLGIDSDVISLNNRLHSPFSHVKSEKLLFTLLLSNFFHIMIIIALVMRYFEVMNR